MIFGSHWYVLSARVRNFKSFGPTWTELQFASPNLVGIVGPNGSGKSSLLEALQFAAGTPGNELRVKTLKELCNNIGAEQLCEVEFTVAQQPLSFSKAALARNLTQQHKIRAALTPEGTRAFQIDGKNKSAAQVKEFLRARGICLHSPSVIRQATITHYADANSPQDIAAVLAGASGLARWDQETARAMAELRAARDALQEISSNISKLRQLIGNDDKKLASLERASQIHKSIQELCCGMAQAYQKQQAAASASILDKEVELVLLQDQLDLTIKQLHGLEKGMNQEDADSRKVKGKGVNNEDEPSMLSLMKEQVTLEEQVKQAEIKLRAGQEHAAEFAQNAPQLQRLHLLISVQASGLQDLEARVEDLSAQVQEAKEAEGCEEAVDLGASTKDLLAASLAALEKAGKAKEQQERQLEQLQIDLQESEAELFSMEQQQAALNISLAAAKDSPLKLTTQLEKCQEEAQAVQVSHQETQVRIQVLQATIGGPMSRTQAQHPIHSRPAPPLESPVSVAQLHELFTFNASAIKLGASHLCKALSVISGSTLHALVVPDRAKAQQVMDRPEQYLGNNATAQREGGSQVLRIWPLDCITSADNSAAQRRAQAELGPERITLPLDLVSFDLMHKPAMLRAFGGSVIAADSDTAAKLASKYSLSSVTPDGTVSKRGTVSGGYQGRGGAAFESPSETLLRQKLELAELQVEGHAQAARLRELNTSSTSIETQLLAAHSSNEQAQQQEEAVMAAKKAVGQKRAQVDGMLESLRFLEAQIQNIKADAERYTSLLSTYQRLADRTGATAAAWEQCKLLQAETALCLCITQADLAALQKQNQALLSEQQQLQERQQILILKLGLEEQEVEENVESAQEAINQRLEAFKAALATLQGHLASIMQQVDAAEAMKQEVQRQNQEHEARLADLASKKHAAQSEANALQSKLVAALDQLKELRATNKQLREAMAQLQRDFPGSILAFKHLPEKPLQADATTYNSNIDVASAQKKLQKLKQELGLLDCVQLSVVEQAQYADRRDSVQLFEKRWTALASGSDMLEASIKESHFQVLRTHKQVLHSVSRRFEAMCSTLMPSYEFTLNNCSNNSNPPDTAGSGVASQEPGGEGVTIMFRGLKATAALSAWSSNLEQLSGGQRTLVSLSLLLATACEGSRSSVLLMDEVDAALDEHNLSLVAQLCHALAHGRLNEQKDRHKYADTRTGCGTEGVQIICVSHHAAFQNVCDALVKVSLQGVSTQAAAQVPDTLKGTAQTTLGGMPAQQRGTKGKQLSRRKRT